MEKNRITGAGRGIGRAIAVAFYKEGYNVIIGYAGNDEAANETKKLCLKADEINSDVKSLYPENADQSDVSNNKGEVILVKGDVALEETAQKLVDAALSVNGRIDVLINNAGITRDNLLARMNSEEFDQVIGTNLRGAFLLSQKVTKPMMKQLECSWRSW